MGRGGKQYFHLIPCICPLLVTLTPYVVTRLDTLPLLWESTRCYHIMSMHLCKGKLIFAPALPIC